MSKQKFSVTEHIIPCEGCGSKDWNDWTLLPHEEFNRICPGGGGYLCLPCFCKRVVGSQPAHTKGESDTGVTE